MKNDDNKIKDVRNTVNLISGAYTLPLIEKLFSNSQKISDMDDIYFALAALVDTGRISEAFYMMRGLFGIAGMDGRRRSHSRKSRKSYRKLLSQNSFLIFMM